MTKEEIAEMYPDREVGNVRGSCRNEIKATMPITLMPIPLSFCTWTCTRPEGHDGNHVAYGRGPAAMWSKDGVLLWES